MTTNTQKGLTLVEVIIIIAVFSIPAIMAFLTMRDTREERVCQEVLQTSCPSPLPSALAPKECAYGPGPVYLKPEWKEPFFKMCNDIGGRVEKDRYHQESWRCICPQYEPSDL